MQLAFPTDVTAPAYFSMPEFAFTSGPEVADLCELAGYKPDGAQATMLDGIFAETKAGRPAAFEVCVVCSRQNIKTGLMKQAGIGKMFLLGRRRLVYTAHEWNPACAEMLRDVKELIEGCSYLSRQVRRIYEGNGEEAVELMSGARWMFKTRTSGGMRSLAADDLDLDEGFALLPEHMGSAVPILATRPDAQIFYGSSPGKSKSAVLRGVRDRGRRGNDPALLYAEWTAPPPAEACAKGDSCDHALTTPGCGCDKPDLWKLANPAVPERITIEYIAKERRSLPPAEFGRERMGWWDPAPESETGDVSPLSAERWADLVVDDPSMAPEPDLMLAHGVEVDMDRAFASIGRAGVREDGRLQLEVVDRRRGVRWLVPRCVALNEARNGNAVFAIDGGGPAGSLIPDFEEAGLTVVTLGTADVAEACAEMVDAVNDEDDDLIAHVPDRRLEAAVEGARKRTFRDGGFSFGRKASDVDVTPLLAVTLAKWVMSQLGGVAVFNFADLEQDQDDELDDDNDHV